MIKFSICIPNYNYGLFIGHAIESVLNQTYQDFEIIIVDNASTDNSWEIINLYQTRDRRIKAYQNNYNIGFAPNLDKVAQKATNDFIIMLSADDSMNENALEEYKYILSKEMINTSNLLICSSVNLINESSKKIGERRKNSFHNLANRGKYKDLFNDSLITDYCGYKLFEHIFLNFSVPGSFNSTLFSKNLYEKVGGYGSINTIGPDAHFAYKCLLSGAEVIYVEKTLFNYRVHSLGQLNYTKKRKNINILIDRYIFSEAYSDLQLSYANIKRSEFQFATYTVDCINGAIWKLREGDWIYAFRHFCFGLSAYPNIALRSLKTYLVFCLLILGPIGIFISRLILYNRN
jgi:glycosyltransferase involved in cell wall biosynthesis